MTIHQATKTRVGRSFYVSHKGCGGQVMIGGTVTYSPVTGFGFRGSRFVVDRACWKGWSGFCLSCRAEGAFFTSRKARAIAGAA